MKGQTAVVVLVVSAVMLTMGLSFSKRSTIETKINTDEELLKKAFNAAESGIDYFLGTGKTDYDSPDLNSSAKVEVTTLGEGNTINFDEFIPIGNRDFYWLVDHNDDGSLGTSYYSGASLWVCTTNNYAGSIAIDYLYKSGASYGIRRYGFNFNANPGSQITNFSYSNSDCVEIMTGAPGNSPLLLTITPILQGGKFYIEGLPGIIFSKQGIDIKSVGRAGGTQAGVGANLVNSRVSVRKRYLIPSFLLSGLTAEVSVLSD